MKQGQASRDGRDEAYRTPIAHGVNKTAVSLMGQATTSSKPPLYHGGRGITAPPSDNEVHCCGSQGKH